MKILAIFITKLVSFCLRMIGRGGSLPGNIGLRINPKLLKGLSMDGPIIVVTGTNGKTSTANMISELFEVAGKKVISNKKGDNMREGITTTLVTNATLKGKIRADVAVLEVDELNIPYIIRDLDVSALVVTNFFRDQLDRAKEMEQLIHKIETAIVNFEGILVLNGNDPNVVRLHDVAKNANSIYYTMDQYDGSSFVSNEASEGKFCPRCQAALEYDFYQYSHIGKFHCSKCDFQTPVSFVDGHVEHVEKRMFSCENLAFIAPQDGVYTMYNCMAVLCVAKLYDVDFKYAKQAFEQFKVPNGRNECFDLKNRSLYLNLIKNPTGANEVMKVIEQDHSEKSILIVLNDNIQDGCDISWIYDTQFEKLFSDHTNDIIISGLRCYDMALRLTYSNQCKNNISVYESLQEGVEHLFEAEGNLYAIATYTALQPTRNLIVKQIKGGRA